MRIAGTNAAAASAVIALSGTLQAGLATRVAGPVTLGMTLIALFVLTLLISALWYDRACATYLDPHISPPP
ncbi:hypothetical protein [Streptomyces sp. NPDC012508]|uniref:hypothetical protein n=1 Tax=Streptomyces sp. NPDC012508 TaxID=3364837 RepID=UPI0036B3D86B